MQKQRWRVTKEQLLAGRIVWTPKPPTDICISSDNKRHVWITDMMADEGTKSVMKFHCEHCGEEVTSSQYRSLHDPMYRR